MRVNRSVSSAFAMIFVLLLSTSQPVAAKPSRLIQNNMAVFTAIDFVPNIETIGVAVSGTGLPPTAQLFYRQSNESVWHAGHSLVRIDDGRLIGSLFNLSPATIYDIKVTDISSEINGSATTKPDELSFTPSVILNVDDSALPGGDGSAAAPFQTIQNAVDHATPGTQVLVADGIYREAITFPASGTPGNWIQVKAAGNAAILDSADYLSGSIWTSTSTAKVWFTRVSDPVAYLARGGNRFYQYDDKTGLMQAIGHGGVTINEGWFYELSTQRLYIRNLDNPASYMWRLPRLNHAFDVVARDWIWIEGFGIQFYGTTTNGCGVCTINASHVVIRRNRIHNMQLGIFINWNGTDDQGNDVRIESNEVYDPLVNEWPWAAVKASYMEGTGIIIRGHRGAIVRDNNVHNFFNGIYTGSSGALENPELAFDADIYRNYIHHVSDDGLEPEGACVNQRFRNNTVDHSFIGISIAPITQGPTWVLRNAFTGFTGRGIKFANNSDGIVLIYQNTGWTSASNINAVDLITSIHNVKMRNNIFQSSGYSVNEVPTGSTGNDWNYDNWYTTRGATGPHFKWENVNYNTISALCAASGLECNGSENLPGFTNPTGGDFTLLSSSPNIDRGLVIPGINDDFAGNAPDVGAYEFGSGPPPTVLSSVRANSNPSAADHVDFTVTFSAVVSGVDNFDFGLTAVGVTGAVVTNVTGSGATRTVTVNTGSGNGTIRLDVVDDDSIRDVANRPLGGAGIGNGDFTSGESYTIVRGSTLLVNSVLPTSRSVQVGTTATVFNTVLNGGTTTANGVTLSMANPPSGTFAYRESDCSTNELIGPINPVLDIAAGGASCYVLYFIPSSPFAAVDVHIRAQAANAASTNLLPGINTWTLRATNSPGPDIVALTTTTDFHQVSCSGTKPFAVAMSNVGAATSPVTVTADTGSASLPFSMLIQESDPATGIIIGDNILENVGAGENRTVVVWVTFHGCVGFDPAAHRIFIRFKDAGNNLIGSTSTAVSTNR
jgi:hypothetical protein